MSETGFDVAVGPDKVVTTVTCMKCGHHATINGLQFGPSMIEREPEGWDPVQIVKDSVAKIKRSHCECWAFGDACCGCHFRYDTGPECDEAYIHCFRLSDSEAACDKDPKLLHCGCWYRKGACCTCEDRPCKEPRP